jgi:hypothetical protein
MASFSSLHTPTENYNLLPGQFANVQTDQEKEGDCLFNH